MGRRIESRGKVWEKQKGEDRAKVSESLADLQEEPDAATGLPTSSSGPLAEVESLWYLQSQRVAEGWL